MLRVIGVGDNFVDRYIYSGIMYPGGNSVNFSVYARMLGCESAYCGVLAKDAEAEMILRALDAFGVEHGQCPVMSEGETGKGSIRLVDGDRVITDDNDNGSVKHTPLRLTDDLLHYFGSFDVIHSSYFAFLEDQLGRLHSTGVPVVYDFADGWDADKLRELCPHISLAFLSGSGRDRAELEAALQLCCTSGCELALATIGKQGALAWDGKQFYHCLPYRKGGAVTDTMGAGDSFLTGFAVSYYEGKKRLRELMEPSAGDWMSKEDVTEYYGQLLGYSMQAGNAMAIRTCMTNGSFGRGERIAVPV